MPELFNLSDIAFAIPTALELDKMRPGVSRRNLLRISFDFCRNKRNAECNTFRHSISAGARIAWNHYYRSQLLCVLNSVPVFDFVKEPYAESPIPAAPEDHSSGMFSEYLSEVSHYRNAEILDIHIIQFVDRVTERYSISELRTCDKDEFPTSACRGPTTVVRIMAPFDRGQYWQRIAKRSEFPILTSHPFKQPC